jgi:hypothetical protein
MWEWLADSALSEWLTATPGLVGWLTGLHLAGAVVLVGALFVLDLRLLGLFARAGMAMLWRRALPLAAAGLVVALVAGAGLFATAPDEFAQLSSFRIKTLLLLATAAHLLAFRLTLWPDLAGRGPTPSWLETRLHAAFSIMLLTGIVVAGALTGPERAATDFSAPANTGPFDPLDVFGF